MTIFFPDLSNFQAGLRIQPGTVAVCAKSSEGTYYTDPSYLPFKAQAAAVGALFWGYHFLTAGNGAVQADYCYKIVGSTPVMLDVEPTGVSRPTVSDCQAFIARMKQLGGRVCLAYFPEWYWQQVGGDLSSLGVPIVASGYPGGYSDTASQWRAYGGATPVIWQYTNAEPYGGMSVDFNAFPGTVTDLAALINGATIGAFVMPNVPASIAAKWPDLATEFPPNAPYTDETAQIWSDAGARAAALYSLQARNAINALASKAAPAPIDVNALAQALAPLVAALLQKA